MPECVRIADRHKHAAEVALVKFHAIFLPELSESPLGFGLFASHLSSNPRWMTGGHHVLEEVASHRHETLRLCLECSDPRGPPWPHTMRMCFSAEGERPRFSRVSRRIASSSWQFGSTTKCVTVSSSSNECHLTDEAKRMHQAPDATANCEISHPSHVDHGQDGSNHVERAG